MRGVLDIVENVEAHDGVSRCRLVHGACERRDGLREVGSHADHDEDEDADEQEARQHPSQKWRMEGSPSVRRPNGGKSAGVMVCARPGLDYAPIQKIEEDMKVRKE